MHLTVDGGNYLARAVYKVIDAQCKVTAQAVTGVTKQTIQTPGSTQVAPGYRYFPTKTDLIAELVAAVAGRELSAMAAAAAAAPGPLSALAACIVTFAARALSERRLAWAVIGEPVEARVDAMRLDFRQSLAAEIGARVRTAIAGGHLPEQDAGVAAPAIVGALMEGLLGPLAPSPADDASAREAVQSATLLALRALGVIDARARGLVAQCALP